MKKYSIDQEKLNKLAALSVNTGLCIQPGQDLLITSPVEALPLVRRIAFHAYRAGANLVTPFFSDPELTLTRYKHAPDTSFDKAPSWLFKGMGEAFDNNTARLAIVGDDPMLLEKQDPEKISRSNKAVSNASKPARERITSFQINWNIVAWPGQAWAARVFPSLPASEAQRRLAEAIFAASRVNSVDPGEAWKSHNDNLQKRSSWLNKKNFEYLYFNGPGTSLKVGLAENHEWMGGASKSQNGIVCNPNIPSEEVFTTPHRLKVEGTVCSTKPLSHQGTLIDEIRVTFKEGRIIEAKAKKGEHVLRKLLEADEGASRLGEVALVPDSSPISRSNLLFFNTLFDENAACHIALGQCYTKCFKNGEKLSKNELESFGGNTSMIHIDWMIGSKNIDVDGLHVNGSSTPIFRSGEWVN